MKYDERRHGAQGEQAGGNEVTGSPEPERQDGQDREDEQRPQHEAGRAMLIRLNPEQCVGRPGRRGTKR